MAVFEKTYVSDDRHSVTYERWSKEIEITINGNRISDGTKRNSRTPLSQAPKKKKPLGMRGLLKIVKKAPQLQNKDAFTKKMKTFNPTDVRNAIDLHTEIRLSPNASRSRD